MKDFRNWRRHKTTSRWSPPRFRATARLRHLAPPLAWLAAPLLAALLLPLIVVPLERGTTSTPAMPLPTALPTALPAAPRPTAADAPQPKVSVYLSHSGQIESLPLEDYVTGVLAAEMPADFELEALKAQAVAARTFIMRRLLAGDVSGVPVPGADVTDTISHQAYVSKAALEQTWERGGKGAALAKLRRAVLETRGVIMTYKGQPITASFFASSGGYTENSEEYWSATVPYLRSVASPWEKDITPNYTMSYTFSPSEMLTKLGIRTTSASKDVALKTQSIASTSGEVPFIEVLSMTTGHRIKEISIGGVVFTGREVREKLQLRSSQFTCTVDNNNIVITTYGNGHGIGMSQWGADGLAREGGTATQILKHYYSGISFTQVSTLLKK